MRSCLSLLSISIIVVACGQGQSDKKNSTAPGGSSPPVVTLPGKPANSNSASAAASPGQAPLPPAPPAGTTGNRGSQANDGSATAAPVIPVNSPAGQFLKSIQGRWRTSCESSDAAGTSLFYAMDFTGETWSSLFFEFTNNAACLHIAAPNEGIPRSYGIAAMTALADGWYQIEGSCRSSANGCQGKQVIAVRLKEGGGIQVKKIAAPNIYAPAGVTQMDMQF